jgi:S1/P1 Nuclease
MGRGWRPSFSHSFRGDIHQPLHAATNTDRGGTCQRVNVTPAEDNLHYAWDDAVVTVLEKQLGTTEPEATARKLEALYPSARDLATWKPGESEQIAWESHQLAKSDVYRALGIPERLCTLHLCDPAHEHTPDAEPNVFGARGAGCRAPTSKGRTSAGGSAQSNLVIG